jgi:hypothetical protein
VVFCIMFEGENEVDVVLGHLLGLIYLSPYDQAYNWENNFAEKPGFTEPDQERLSRLMTQMSLRLLEGQGEAKYIVGVGNNCTFVGLSKEEMFSSLSNLLIEKPLLFNRLKNRNFMSNCRRFKSRYSTPRCPRREPREGCTGSCEIDLQR